jgi:alkylation response protein AidB-like acyl-CoA dehydrogenase
MRDLPSIVGAARDLACGPLRQNAARIDAEARWPEENLRALQAAGLAGLAVPAAHGGLGQGLVALAQVCETLGRECASTAISFGMHCVGAAVIASKATPYQARTYLEPIAAGKHLTTLALSEPGSGAHFFYPSVRLAAAADTAGYRATGGKAFVTNGGRADSYVVSTVAAAPDAPPGHFSCVLVARDAPGVSWGPPWAGFGMRGNSSTSMELRDVAISRDDLLGAEGDQIWFVFEVVAPFFLMSMSGTYLGLAAAALDEARAHLERRTYRHSGSSLAEVGVLQHRLGALWAKVERTRRLVYWAAAEGDSRGPSALPAVCSAKAEVADCVVDVANEAMTLCGGLAYRDDARLTRILRDARAAHVMAPTTDILRTWAGRALLGQPLLGI